MKYVVEVTRRAERQLRAITEWYRQQDAAAADRWAERCERMFETLEFNPEHNALARESEDLELELREVYFGSGRRKTHRVVFTIVGRSVQVVAVRHFAQRDLTATDIDSE